MLFLRRLSRAVFGCFNLFYQFQYVIPIIWQQKQNAEICKTGLELGDTL